MPGNVAAGQGALWPISVAWCRAGRRLRERRIFVRRLAIILVGTAHALAAGPLSAQEVDPGRVRAAVERALTPVQDGLKTFGARKSLPPVQALPTLPAAYRKAG